MEEVQAPGAAAHSPPCPVCAAPTRRHLADLFDDRYGLPGRWEVRACPACGHRHLAGPPPPEVVARLYTERYPRAGADPAAWRPSPAAEGLRAWWRGARGRAYAWVPARVRVLDVGCGLGEGLGYHRARGCEAEGIEADAHARPVAEAHGLKVRIGLFGPDSFPPASFDWVTLDQVLEHAADPLATLRAVAGVLRPGGRAAVATPNAGGWGARLLGRRWIHWHVPYHVQGFTRRSLREAAARAGLEVLALRTVTSADWLRWQGWHLALPAREGAPSSFWAPSAGGRPRTRRGLLVEGLHAAGALHAATRLLDALRLGDNLVCVLGRP